MRKLIAIVLITFLVAPAPSFAITSTWVPFSTPAGATQIRQFAFDPSGDMCLADRLSGIWCNFGGSWAQYNTGLPTASSNILTWTVYYDSRDSEWIVGTCEGAASCDDTHGGTVGYFRSSNAASWTQITLPNAMNNLPSYSGAIVTPTGGLILGAYFGANGTCGTAISSNGGATTSSVTTCPANTASAPGGVYADLYDSGLGVTLMGTEQNGVYCSTDSGANWSVISPPDQANGGVSLGNAQGLGYDSSGNPIMGTQDGAWKATGGSGCTGGWTWSHVFNTSGTARTRTMYVDPENNIWLGLSTASGFPIPVYVSTDGGNTWNTNGNGLPTGQEAWWYVQGTVDGQMYVLLQNPSNNNAGTIYKTVTVVQPAPALGMFARLTRWLETPRWWNDFSFRKSWRIKNFLTSFS